MHGNSEFAAVVAREWADEAKGKTCFICLETTEEGLVCGCECDDATAFAHTSCLVRQARIAVEDAGDVSAAWLEDTLRICECGVCGEFLYGEVTHAVAWGCWKTYASRPERDSLRQFVAVGLGNCLACFVVNCICNMVQASRDRKMK